MQIIRAAAPHIDVVCRITQDTIRAVYPHYYPRGAVDFFLAHHNDENIRRDIAAGIVYLLDAGGVFAGTVTLRGNEICRLFVLPEFQRKGFGRMLMEFAEKSILASNENIVLDASLPAKAIYLKRGYRPVESHSIQTGNGDFLCYDVMKKG